MVALLMQSLVAEVIRGGVVVPLVWVIGVVLLVAGAVSLFRGGIFVGVALIILGILLGGLNVL